MSSTEPIYPDPLTYPPEEEDARGAEAEGQPEAASHSARSQGAGSRRSQGVQSTPQLLRSLEVRLELLRARGLPVPELSIPDAYARHLAEHALMLVDGKGASRGYDATDPDGFRYRIVGRKGGRGSADVVVPGIPHRQFDRILLTRFGSGYGILYAGMARVEPFLRAAEYRQETNEWVLGTWDPFWAGEAVDDVTVVFRIAAARVVRDDDFPLIESFSTPPSYRSRQTRSGLVPPQA